ncbi:GNAT family N-acetyltransferase [Herbidospora galbida]|uniref:GNAT family N-acetyltransferase n=1 Tax=Herbidospora galbida TaxID=2575442 RepID=A0A4U3MLN4_9ACTN|nr:GNAT family N-acetyltransferase [Herbidospora galbida]TKK90381.1 GNAT family N-acetyltransferase [Herbidospora galbida]
MSEFVLELRHRTPPQDWIAAICAIHDDVFLREPFAWTPDTSQENAEDLHRLAGDPSFSAVIAWHAGEPVGYAYGHRLPADHGWWRAIPEPLPAEFTDEWDGRTFALVSLAVLPNRRGHGVGRRLIDSLLGSRGEERAVLSVQPTALSTQSIYRHLGWRLIGRNGPFAGITPPRWDVYVMETLSRPSPAP